MKKYNLSKIMKRAWELVRKAKINFTEALRFSWTVAKRKLLWKINTTCLMELLLGTSGADTDVLERIINVTGTVTTRTIE